MTVGESNPVLKIESVFCTKWSGGAFRVAGRPYSALTFRVSGSAVIKGGEKEYRVNPGEILYLPQGMEYTAKYTDTEVVVIHFVTQKNDAEIKVYSLQNTEWVFKLFLSALQLWHSRNPSYFVHTLGKLYTLLGTLSEAETASVLPRYFVQAVSLIHTHFKDSGLNIDWLCEKAGIGKTVFRQLFKKYYQKTPTEYITDLRIENARNLIFSGTAVEIAALQSGFNDPKYFARVVKKKCGCTPRAFKTLGK